jgi:hypothetical protein
MSLSIYDPEKGCFVLKQWIPEKINAFHPDFVKVHMPNFLSELRTDSRQTKAGQTLSHYVEKVRETRPTHGTMFGLSEKVTSAQPKKMMKRVSTDKKEFHIYNKAGMPKGVKK